MDGNTKLLCSSSSPMGRKYHGTIPNERNPYSYLVIAHGFLLTGDKDPRRPDLRLFFGPLLVVIVIPVIIKFEGNTKIKFPANSAARKKVQMHPNPEVFSPPLSVCAAALSFLRCVCLLV
jgi:hypothetical protein